MKYYIILNGRQAGPFEENQLLSMGVTRSTMVWREGMQNWQEAGQLAELAYLFNNNNGNSNGNFQGGQTQQPPRWDQYQGNYSPYNSNIPPMPKTWLVESILATLFCCLPFGIAGIVYASKVSTSYLMGNYALAQKQSDDAKKWTLISVLAGLASIIISIIYYAIVYSSALMLGF